VKRTPLQRKTPLRARPPSERKPRARKPSKYKLRVRDTEYMLAVKRLACAARDLSMFHPCEGVIEADHAGRRPLGRKCDDRETIPLCTEHHRQRTDFSGAFRKWNGSQMRAWLDEKIQDTQRQLRRFFGPTG